MKINYALSAYPLSQTYQRKLECLVDEPIQFFLLHELRQKSLPELWKFLRTLKPQSFFLPLEDQNSITLLPILQLIAKITTPKELIVVNPDTSFKTIRLKQLISSSFNLGWATITSFIAHQDSARKMAQLISEPIINLPLKYHKNAPILYLNANLWFGVKAGGSVGHIAGVINAFAQKGLQVDYAAVDKSSLLSPSVNYLPLPVPIAFGMPAELNYYSFNRQAIHYLLQLKKDSKWKFIYQRMSISNYSGVYLSRYFNIPLVLEYNGSEAWIAKNWGTKLRYHDSAVQAEEVNLKHAHLILTISKVLKDELVTRGVNPEKIVCYPNCIDPEIFNPERFTAEESLQIRTKHQIPADALVFTFVGTFGQWHGVDILAMAIRSLIEEHESWLIDQKVYFLLVGDGVKMSEVKQILGPFINKPYIKLTGLVSQTEAPVYLSSSNVLLSPHVANKDGQPFFGSPTKLFEYMAMEKAIIASNLEQIGEVLKNGLCSTQLPAQAPQSSNTELGILCEPGNVQQLVHAIQFLAQNEKWRTLLGTNARKEALAKYTWEHHVNALLSKFN